MNATHWQKINTLKDYLDKKIERGIAVFKALFEKIAKQDIDLIVITFTYEHLEILEKRGESFQMNTSLVGTINRYEIEELMKLGEENDGRYADFCETQMLDMASLLIKSWLTECFYSAKDKQEITTQFYYKENHDGLEIFDLNATKQLFEKSEFETYIRNNQKKQIQLLQ